MVCIGQTYAQYSPYFDPKTSRVEWMKDTANTYYAQMVYLMGDNSYQNSMGTSLDTVITVTNTARALSYYLDTLTISYIYMINNTSGQTLYIGDNSNVLNHGSPLLYLDAFKGENNYYPETTDMYVVATANTNVRIKLIYR